MGFGVKCQNNISSIDSKTKPRVRQKRRSEQFNKVNLTRCQNRYNDFTSRLGKDQMKICRGNNGWEFKPSIFVLFCSELFGEFKFLDRNALFCIMPCLWLQKYFILRYIEDSNCATPQQKLKFEKFFIVWTFKCCNVLFSPVNSCPISYHVLYHW